MNLPEEIEAVCLLGWHIYPSSKRTKAACFKGASEAASCDLDIVAGWHKDFDVPNYRVVCGPSNIWGVDLDVPSPDHAADGVAAFTRLIAGRQIPPRPTTRSGGGGLAVFFNHAMENIHGKTGYPEPGIDPRRGRLSVTIPPSMHHRTGRKYKWLTAPWIVAPPVAPPWLVALFEPPPEASLPRPAALTNDTFARRRLIKAVHMIHTAGSGAGNDTLNKAAYMVARDVGAGAITEREATENLYAAAQARCIPGREALDTIKSAMRAGMARPRERV